ncbi:TIGR03564 family F420-dependent LLM class oxidoreductase [Pseudonocardia sp. CA-142604]|uniref:TIGR03564 family F420-dependent LLM class oxidoreductase n=1 Tax=Pseudonocardia sp. CA-142604 TaxID=3240024 RepID=UPI003D940FAF
MRIGLSIEGSAPLPEVLARIERAAADGFARAWLSDVGGWDPLTALAALGERAPGIEVGTAVTQLFGRHPLLLAGQVLTAQAAVGGRLTLGVAPSHQMVVEQRLGLPWDRPVSRVQEHLDVLVPLLQGKDVEFHGRTVTAAGGVDAPGATPTAVLLAAHGPRMLTLAGERADGVLTLWARPDLVADYIVPTVTTAAAGRAAPRVVVGLNATVTADPDRARRYVAEHLALAATLPSYRGSLDRQGAAGLEDVIVAGDEKDVEAAVRRYADAGATELVLLSSGPQDDRARTIAFFADLARRAR